MKHRDILNILSDMRAAPLNAEGFCYGNIENDLAGVTVAFTANLEAINFARDHGDNLIIIHERMFFPTDYSGARLEHYLCDKINLPRLTALANGGITVLLIKDGLEKAYLRPAIEKALGFPAAPNLDALYEVEPMAIGDYAKAAMKKLGVDRARLTARPGQMIRKVAIVNGGEGITRAPDSLVKYLTSGADLLICGETDEYPKWAALDCNIAMLEIGHTVFDNLGLKHFSDKLKETLSNTPVHFYEIEKPWRVASQGGA